MSEDRDLATVATFWNVADAETAKNALDAAGIDSFVQDEHTVDWLTAVAIKGVRLRVRAADFMRASEILETPAAPAGEVEPPEEERPPSANTCPACGSADVRPRRHVLALALITVLAIAYGFAFDELEAAFWLIAAAAIFAFIGGVWTCSECGESWR